MESEPGEGVLGRRTACAQPGVRSRWVLLHSTPTRVRRRVARARRRPERLDPITLLDAILGTPDNLHHWEDELLAYSASTAPKPRSKREKPSVSPPNLADRLTTLVRLRGQAFLRNALGDIDGASDLLERLAEALRLLDETTPDDRSDDPTRTGTAAKGGRQPGLGR